MGLFSFFTRGSRARKAAGVAAQSALQAIEKLGADPPAYERFKVIAQVCRTHFAPTPDGARAMNLFLPQVGLLLPTQLPLALQVGDAFDKLVGKQPSNKDFLFVFKSASPASPVPLLILGSFIHDSTVKYAMNSAVSIMERNPSVSASEVAKTTSLQVKQVEILRHAIPRR